MRNSPFYLLLPLILLVACNNKKTLFTLLPSSATNIHFSNTIHETDTVNVLDFENVYNGGGVGIADFNSDGLQDIYFTGNTVPNKLYLNKGKFQFDDITSISGVEGKGRWSRGVATVDINNDGLMDMYVCASVKDNPEERRNLLYVNQGNNENKIPVFKEMASEYGLNDTTQTTMAAFFDYDNDGDLDVYLCVNHIIDGDFPNRFRPRMIKGEHPSTGRLYQNNWNDTLKHPTFTDVSVKAGALIEGYGHAVSIADINNDGWKDIYVTNDYLAQNILYINNHDGTFTDKVTEYFKHTSANSMGNDITDINNDGLADVIELDMNPEDNFRKKMMMNANSYQTYQNSDALGYQYQYVRNTLQLNRGPRIGNNDSVGSPFFSEIAFFAGIAETDWSWTPMVTDFDNDGYRDIIITNGFPRDVTDHDFVAFRKDAFSVTTKKDLLEQIPEVKLHNYGYHNSGNLKFTDETTAWGLQNASFSNGAAYADLDNDGDLDFVVNNINDEAFVYQNNLRTNSKEDKHYLELSLKGDSLNRNGIGAVINIYYDSRKQFYENTPYRGYLSSVQQNPHFGLDTVSVVDSVVIIWPGGQYQKLTNVKADQILSITKAASASTVAPMPAFANNSLFKDITLMSQTGYIDVERDFVDFNIQKLLPHKYSESGPAMAVADLDGNHLDDLVLGGSYGHSAMIFLQQNNGSFQKKELIPGGTDFTKPWEDAGIVLFDADKDGDIDIYIASGGYENTANTKSYADNLFVNDGKGGFYKDAAALPVNLTSKSCVRAVDYDKDGDLDLFLAGRVEPWMYPKPVSSSIYRNDSKDGKITFTDITSTVAPSLKNVGLISDAIFTDFDNDDWPDLILAGEWMPITFLKNEKGVFKDITANSGVDKAIGWWRSLLPGDFDNDGDIDYIAGNLGQNSFYRASDKYPVHVYAKDFDKNGSYDAVPSLFLPSSQQDHTLKEYPAQVRDDMVKQMIGFRSKYQNYKLYANATIDQMFTAEEMKGVQTVTANSFSHVFIRNNGNGHFEMIQLPDEAQFSCLNGMVADDIDGDGLLDLLAAGNDYGTEVAVGRYDACSGLVLKGNGKGDFTSLSMLQSGLFIPGNGKALTSVISPSGKLLIAASQNRGPLKIFESRNSLTLQRAEPTDIYALLIFKDGKKQKREFGFGTSYLSQSARYFSIPPGVVSIEIVDYLSKKRILSIP